MHPVPDSDAGGSPARLSPHHGACSALKQALGTANLDESLVASFLIGNFEWRGCTSAIRSREQKRRRLRLRHHLRMPPISSQSSWREGSHMGRISTGKDKAPESQFSLVNACRIAMKARGNRIGSITDLKTSCLSAGRPDLAYKLVEQLQNALDSLKHRVEIDESVVSEIRKEVAPRPGSATSVSGECRTCRPILKSRIRIRFGGSITSCARRLAFFPTKLGTVSKRRCPSKTSGLFG